MLGFLAGVPGRLKTLVDRLTSTRASNLDNLDAAISTRAPSSTALSTSVWTSALATELDGLAPAIAAIPTSVINSVQYGSMSMSTGTSATATVTSVNTAKSVLIHLGVQSTSTTVNDYMVRFELTNSTTVTARRAGTGTTVSASFVLVEFK